MKSFEQWTREQKTKKNTQTSSTPNSFEEWTRRNNQAAQKKQEVEDALFASSTPVLPKRNAGYTLTAPSVSLPGVKNQGNLLSMNVGQEQKKRALIDEQIEALEEEKKLLNKEKDLWSNSQFKGPKWAEVDAQIQAIDRQIAQLDRSTWSQDVISQAENEQKNRADAYEYTAETRRMLNMDTQMAEAYAGQLEKIKESQKQFEREYNQFMDVDPARSQAAKRNYDAVTDLIGQIESKVSWEDIDRAKTLQRQAQLNQVVNQPGFSYMSGYKSTLTGQRPQESINKGGAIYKSTDGWGDLTYELVNKIPEAIDIERQNASVTGGKDVGSDKMYLLQMNDREVSIYNYYYRNDKKTADEYLELLKPELLERQANKYLANIQQMAKESPGAASVMSVGMGIASLPSAVGQVLDYLDDGKIEINSAYNNMPRAQKAIRETVGQQIEEKLGDKWGKVGSAGYQLGMSMADFLAAAGVSGGVGNLASVLLGGSAAAQTTIEAKQRGLSDGQAISLGIISGVAEWFTERFSIEKLLDVADMGKSAGSYILKNIIAEGGEEGASNLINLAADVLISKDKSQWKQTVDAYKNAGYEEKSAFMMAFNDQVMQLGADVLGGGISGGLLGGGNVAINNAAYAMSRPSGAYQQRQQTMDAIMQMAKQLEAPQQATQQTVQRPTVQLPQIPQVQPQTQQQTDQQPQPQPQTQQQTTVQPAIQRPEIPTQAQTSLTQEPTQEPTQGPVTQQPLGQQVTSRIDVTELERTGAEAGARTQDIESAKRISNATGRQIVFYDADPSQNGYYHNGVIYINARAGDPLAQIISHEMTHSVELSGVYSKLSAIVLNRIQQTGGNLEQMRQEKIDLYKRNGVTLSDQRAVDAELVAEYVAKNLLTDENQILQVVQNDRSLGERIRDWIDSLLAKFGNEAAAERNFLTKARDLYSKALQQTQTGTRQIGTQTQVESVQNSGTNDADVLQKTLDMIQFSISDPNKQAAMIGNLRQYLNGGMSIQELNQKIGGRSAQSAVAAERSTLSTEAQKIKNAARRQQMSVEQYLQSNWELFDVDGEWNEAAREALDDERGVRYSITEPFVDEDGNNYEAAVLLDTDAFDGVAPRSWWKVLKEKLEKRVGESTFIMPVLDENGEIQNLEFAKPEERASKNGKKPHTVLGELYRTNDNLSKLSAIHIDEVVEVSNEKEPYYTEPDEHGWLDENGWLHRTAYVINSKNGGIYQITMDIAKARDGRVILYALDGKTKKVGNAKVNSLKLRGSTQNSNFEDRVSRDDEKVKYSFSEEADQIEDEHEMAFDALLRDVEREQETQAMRPERLEDTRRSLESYMDMQDRMWAQEAKEELSADKISAQFNRRPTTIREDLAEAKSAFIRKMVDAGEAVARIGKAVGDKSLYHYYNMARASSNAAISMITDKRTDTMGNVTGDGLNEVLKTVRDKGNDYYKRFQLYLYHMHNIDRMSRENPDRVLQSAAEFQEFTMTHPELSRYAEFQIETMAANPDHELNVEAREYIRLRDAMRKAENTRNKPVFGFEVTAEDSRTIVQRLINEHPEFAQEAQKVYDYIDNLLRYRVDSGLITEADYEMLKSIYPHYVPTYRSFEWDNQPQTKQKGKVQIGKTIQRATGGDAKLMPLHKALSQQTMSVVREGSKNRFGQRLMQDNENGQAYEHIFDVKEYDNNFSENTFDRPEDEELKKTNTFVVRQDGKLWEMTISPALYEAVQALSPERQENNAGIRLVRKGNDLFKKLVTGYNPTFLVRNLLRDLQDAGFYSADLSEFVKQYPQAIREMQKDGKYWQQYKALGGTYSSVFDYETGDMNKGGRLKQNTIGRIEALNQAIEQAPRLAEFMATVKKAEKDHGQATMDDLMEAMYNAADITVNFGRAGTLGKKLNANWVPFLNPSIQGFSKQVRSLTETKGVKDWARLAVKAALFGVAPMLLNALIYGDDDEWDDLKERDKDLYYLFKIKDGLWLKLPKGRTLSLIGMTADRAIDAAQGEEVDWGGFIETAAEQTAPANPFENNILAAAYNTHLFDPDNPGETWYGTDIESQRLQNYAPAERYDAGTDIFSKWLGKVTKLSPAKINYLLDQYTGVVGDVLLPLLSPQAERDMFSAAFTIDSNYSNRFSNEFYEMADELTYQKNTPDATGVDNILNRFWSKQSTVISEVNKAIRQIEANTELKNKDKKELTAAQYGIRNALMENALETLDAYTEAAEYYYNASSQANEDDRIDEAYRQANREIFGAEYALSTYDRDVYVTAGQMFLGSDISFEAFYDFYFAQKDIEATGYEKTNEKRNLIMQSGLTDEQKEALYTKYVSDTRADDIAAFREAGMGMDTFMQIQNQYAAIENMKLSSSEKRTEFSRWLFKQPLNAQQDAVASEVFSFYSHISAQESKYEQLINAGVSDEDAYSISNDLFALEPEEGKSDVSARQKYKAIADKKLKEADAMKAYGVVMGESEYKKLQAANDLALDPNVYAEVKYLMPEYDENGNGSYSNAEIEAAIKAYAKENRHVDNGDKALLWQMLTGSDSTKNNPFSKSLAKRYLEELSELKGEE